MCDKFHRQICSIMWHVPISTHLQLPPASARHCLAVLPQHCFLSGCLCRHPPDNTAFAGHHPPIRYIDLPWVSHISSQTCRQRTGITQYQSLRKLQTLESQPAIAHWKEEFAGSLDQTMGTKGVTWTAEVTKARSLTAGPLNPLPCCFSALPLLMCWLCSPLLRLMSPTGPGRLQPVHSQITL